MKTYKMNIVQYTGLISDMPFMGRFTKGHFTPEEFLSCLQGDAFDWALIEECMVEDIHQDWWRVVPGKGDSYMTAVPNSRGAFPVTYCNWLDIYDEKTISSVQGGEGHMEEDSMEPSYDLEADIKKVEDGLEKAEKAPLEESEDFWRGYRIAVSDVLFYLRTRGKKKTIRKFKKVARR